MGRGYRPRPSIFLGYVSRVPDVGVYEAIVVGGGAAGLSASLVLGRTCRSTLVLDDGRPRNAVADRMHGLISRDGTPPLDLLRLARAELKRYDTVRFVEAHVEAIWRRAGGFELRTRDGSLHQAQRVLLATGVCDALPAIEGLNETWGRSAFVCPYCDGWEMRGKRIAVVGTGAKAVELAQELRQWSRDIVVCTQGDDALSAHQQAWLEAARLPRITSPVRRLHAPHGKLQYVEFADGSREACEAMFLSAPLRPRYPLVDMLGCRLRDDGEIDIDDRGRTSIEGVYAAGDAVTKVHQVALAAASGVCAAMAINEDRLKDEVRELIQTARA